MKLWFLCVLSCMVTSCASVYPYRVMNNECGCERYMTVDHQVNVSYVFSARYSVDEAINTSVDVEIANDTDDTLDLSLAHIKVSSRNVPYRQNGRFLPVMISHVPPGHRETLKLVSEPVKLKTNDPWLRIAGEELIVTLKGVRIRGRELKGQIIRFVPDNPKIGS